MLQTHRIKFENFGRELEIMGKIHRNHITQNIITRNFCFQSKWDRRGSRFILLLDQPRKKKKQRKERNILQ